MAHQSKIWSRVRQVNTLWSLLREYYPAALAAFGTDLASCDALAGCAHRGTEPRLGPAALPSRIQTLLRRPGRQRNVASTAATIRAALSSSSRLRDPG